MSKGVQYLGVLPCAICPGLTNIADRDSLRQIGVSISAVYHWPDQGAMSELDVLDVLDVLDELSAAEHSGNGE